MIRAFLIALALICAPAYGQDSLTSSGGGGGAATQGPAGAQGIQGIKGDDGDIGPQGPIGPAGANGTNGTNGGIGQAGPQGIQGPAGPAGQNGTNGETGPAGQIGAQGPIGLTGPAGAQGPQGIQGIQGIAGSASGSHALISIPANSYTSAQMNAGALSTIAGAANRLDFIPFIPAKDLTINEMAIEVTTLIAASQAHIGIYSDLNGLPNTRLAGSTTPLDCATTGIKATAISNLGLIAGQTYWIAILTSSTQTLRGIPLASLIPIAAPTSGTATFTLRRATSTFASGLPATAPATTATSAIAPYARLRAI